MKEAENLAIAEDFLEDIVDPHRIVVKGARTNNLKNVDLSIPKNQLVVVTGVSGSGKSSITMDTLYAEGQRRYVESLSSYARQFLGRMKKPDVDYIRGICPAIAIEQRVTTGNNRSTVGSMTEINEFLRLLYARIGKVYSPTTGEEVKRHEVSDVMDYLKSQPEGAKGLILIPFPKKYQERTLRQELDLLLQRGYTRVFFEGEIRQIEDLIQENIPELAQLAVSMRERGFAILIDRYIVKKDDHNAWMRLGDSVGTAFAESEGECWTEMVSPTSESKQFNNRFEVDGKEYPEPSPQLFNYNNPVGACPLCEGYGKVMGIDPDKVIPDRSKSVYSEAVAPWRGEKSSEWKDQLLKMAHHFQFPVHTPIQDLNPEQVRLLWSGNTFFQGIDAFFKDLEEKTYKIQNRIMLARYRGRTTCPDCGGHRLRPEALCVKLDGKHLGELTALPLDELLEFFVHIKLSAFQESVAKRLLHEIHDRLNIMVELGLGYLTLERISSTLSGGETQRIHLTRTLGSNLTASMYILDEPSVGLHPRDTGRMVQVLKKLRDLGNTVVVVEHEEEVIQNADYLVDMGPEAGVYGGEVVFAGPYSEIHTAAPNSLTTQYMTGKMQIEMPKMRRTATRFITIKGAKQHNLRNINVRIPMRTLTVICGVSGSGKTTLVRDILYPALMQTLPEGTQTALGHFDALEGAAKAFTAVEFINQSPIGKSSRSNPVTYVKAYDAIRNLFTKQPLSKIRGYLPKHFSFNVEGGRCESCKGDGEQIVEMQFLADVRLECDECKGKRFRSEILEVQYKGKSIFDVLNMSVDEGIRFFSDQKEILQRIQPLQDVGLGYVQLGQSSSTLSGGEAQRVKLASFLIGGQSHGTIFFIFDEPTTGLHFHDIKKLLKAMNALVDAGHTVLVVEHNLEVIKSADWVCDLGPEGGKGGGNLVYEGTPEGLAVCKESWTGKYLSEKIRK